MSSNSTDLASLIERIEQAEAPSRELDALIALAKGWQEVSKGWFTPPSLTVRHHKSELPRFTASLDAALTLKPEGSLWAVIDMEDGPIVRLLWPDERGTYIGKYVETRAATPALALCAAALKARLNAA